MMFLRHGLWGGLALPMMLGLGLLKLALFVGLIALAVWLLRSRQQAPQASRAQESAALDILKVRYARGEITTEQYEEMRRTLEGQPRSSAT